MNSVIGLLVKPRVFFAVSCAASLACSVDDRDTSLAEESLSPELETTPPDDEPAPDAAAPAPPPSLPSAPVAAEVGAMPPTPAPTANVLLTISAAGSGRFGRVATLEPSSVACDAPPCTYSLPRGTSIVLHAYTANVGSGFAGWQHDRCTGQGDCPLTLDDDDAVAASYEPANLVFVTSTAVTGNFGGPAQADAICNARAAERGLEGPFRAWMSSTTTDAIDALQGSRGWVRRDGYPVVDSVDSMLEARMFYPIQFDEAGAYQGSRAVWTGTSGNTGRLAPVHCNDWTSADAGVMGAAGRTTLIGVNFGSRGFSSCDTSGGIYCFGVGKNVTLSPTPWAGRLAFLTDQFFPVAGGIAGADAFCQARAQAAGLTRRYKALLATSTQSAAARFDLSDTRPIVRADGALVSSSVRPFFEGMNWLTGINVTPGRAYITNYSIWSGSGSPLQPGTLDTTCSDWTTTEGQSSVGFSTFTTPGEFFGDVGGFFPCDSSLFMGCLEE